MRLIWLCLFLLPKITFAAGAHQHGHVSFEMAIDGMQVAVEIRAPAESFVGFEHKPKTKAEKQAHKDVQKTFKQKGLELVGFSADLECTQTKDSYDWIVEDDHKHKDHHDHDHDKHSGEHSEIKVSYNFNCKKMVKDTKLTIGLTKFFKNVKTIEVAVLPSTGNAFAQVLKDDNHTLSIP